MILSDRSIRELIGCGRITIDPYQEFNVQPCSVDVRLGEVVLEWPRRRQTVDYSARTDEAPGPVKLRYDAPYALDPDELVLGALLERVALPDDVAAQVNGKSSLGRDGLAVHVTAGFVDPGWDGHLTLEIKNMSRNVILLYPGMKIAQVVFFAVDRAVERPYGSGALGSKYQGDRLPVASRYKL